MIIDTPGIDLELELDTDGDATISDDLTGDIYVIRRDELLPIANALLRAYIAHIPTTKGDTP